MRCKRCHAVLSEGRKACPNCGTLIRKKRGNITLSSQAGVDVNPITDWISNTVYSIKTSVRRDSRILILLVALPLVLLGSILLISCGAKSCACSCSCEGNHSAKEKYETRENSREPSMQTAIGETLYYIADGSIMSRSADETYRSIYNSVSATDLQSDGEYLYFREYNLVKRIKPGAENAETVLDYTSEGNYTLGYFLAEGEVYYYLQENQMSLTTLYSDKTLLSGAVAEFGYMKGRIYYTMSDSDASGLYSMKTDGTDNKLVISGVSDYQLGGGYIYAIENEDERKLLTRFDEKGNKLVRWDITALTGGEITSVAANDAWLCFTVATESGSAVYRIEHNSEDIASVFGYSSIIELTGVSGDWYAFESITVADGKETDRTYSIRNSRNGKSAL